MHFDNNSDSSVDILVSVQKHMEEETCPDQYKRSLTFNILEQQHF